jgi:broad specificity phosphatase PhoE
MDLLFVRHGESEANVLGRMQGQLDSPLSAQGREQAAVLGAWMAERSLSFDAAYCSPLRRARETAEIVCRSLGRPAPLLDAELQEVHSGTLQGLDAGEIAERFPTFMQRDITTLGDFEEFGGESYAAVQARTERVIARLVARHKNHEEAASGDSQRVLVVAHGGIIFQLVKALVCRPVPQVAIFRYGNCTSTLVRMRQRRGTYIGEVRWHLPLELIGGAARDPALSAFR